MAGETLEQRVAHVCNFTNGTMFVGMIVADEAERDEAVRLLRAQKHGKLVSVTTRAVSDRERVNERH